MPKIRITCNDPCATDSSSGEDDGSIEEERPTSGGLFVEEISVSVPLIIPTAISTVHLDSLASLKSDSSFKVDELKSSRDGPNCIVLALSSRNPEGTSERKSGILSVLKRLEKSSTAQKGQVDVTNLLSKEDGSIEASPTSINVAVDIPITEKSRRRGSSGHPGVHKQSSGKWGVRIRDPITKTRIWAGSYSTLKEAINVRNKKKLEYVPLRSEMSMRGSLSVQNKPEKSSLGKKSQLNITSSLLQEDGSAKVTPTSIEVAAGLQLSSKMGIQDDSTRAEESKRSMGEHHCIVLGLSSRQPGDTQRKKSGVFPIRNRLDKSSMAVDIPIAKKSPGLGMEKRVGLRLQSSGRWGVKIYDPRKKGQIWLGTYSTVEEANNAYDKKKLEFASPSPAVFKHKKHSVRKAKRKRKKLVVEGIAVYETKSGKWRATIKHPVSRLKLWLGSHETPEEAVESYNRKMLEFDSSYNCGIVGKFSSGVLDSAFSGKAAVNDECIPDVDVDDTCIPTSHNTPKEAVKSYDRIMLEFDSSYNFDSEGKSSSKGKETACVARVLAFHVADESIPAHDIASSVTKNNAEFECPVMKPTGTDKWRVAIRHPMLKCSFSLGSYDTPEEAEEVYNKNQLELKAVLNRDKITCPSADTRSSDVACSAAVDTNGLPVNKPKGVKLCSSGRWMAQIQPPFIKKNKVYLGTFNTVEEAAEAFKRTRREFDAMRSLVDKRKHEGGSEAPKKKMKKKHKAELLPKKTVILNEASMTDDERSRLFEIMVAPESYSHQSRFDCAFVSDYTAVTAMSGQASNNSNERQIHGFPLSPAEHDNGMGVIDSFGQLVGEYSRLDDELWLSRPGDDEFDVHMAMGGDIGELAWDPDLKPSPF